MGNHKRWVQRGGGDFYKWTEPGQELEGKWRGGRDGKFGPLGTIETTDGLVVFPVHTALVFLVEGLALGQEIKIVYTGKEMNAKSGREFKAFEMFVATDDSEPPPPTDDDIPF